jgi:hypothetical protein
MPLSSLVSRAVSGFNGGDPSKYPGAFPPPAGVVANLKNPPDAGRVAGVSTLVVCLAVSTILFAVRFYVKLRITRRFLLEDCTSLFLLQRTIKITLGANKRINSDMPDIMGLYTPNHMRRRRR